MIKVFRGLGTITSPLKLDSVLSGIKLNSVKLIPESPSETYDPLTGGVPPHMTIVISRVSHASLNAAIIDVSNLVFAAFFPCQLTVSNGADQTGMLPASQKVDIGRVTAADSCYVFFGSTQFVIELDYDNVALNETERALLTQLAYL